MNQFYSSLIVNSKQFPTVKQIFKPRYNREYFKRLTANLEHLEHQIASRDKHHDLLPNKQDLINLRKESQVLLSLKNQFEKAEKNSSEDDTNRWAIKDQLEEVENRVFPIVINIPNRYSKHVPGEDVILDEVKPDFAAREKLTKTLSHTKLSYINNCYQKSVVGPNSHYYFGIGAKLQHGLSDYFIANLESKRDFIPISGLCLTRSAVIEAANSIECKTFTNDPGRILTEQPASTALHLVEASRESILGFITTMGTRSSNAPLRLMTNGAGYRKGSTWFDSDDSKITQFETLHALVLNSSIEQYSMKEYKELKDLIWNSFRDLDLPCRLVHCSLDSMLCNEYDAYRIDIWLPSRKEWIQVSRISHYLDYITIRTGMKRGHIIDSMVYDGQALFAAIIENNQTATGKFIIPFVIKEHMVHLTPEEESSYFRENCCYQEALILSKSSVLHNYEQRRYLVKKNYSLGHSEHAIRTSGRRPKLIMLNILFSLIFLMFLDWKEIWIQMVPNSFRRYMYDKIYRVIRRIWWAFTYPEGTRRPKDTPYDELDKSEYEKSMYQRRTELFFKDKPDRGERFMSIKVVLPEEEKPK